MSRKNIIYNKSDCLYGTYGHINALFRNDKYQRQKSDQEQEKGNEEKISPKAENQTSPSSRGEEKSRSQDWRRSSGEQLKREAEALKRDGARTNQKAPSRTRSVDGTMPREASEQSRKITNVRDLDWQELKHYEKVIKVQNERYEDWLRKKRSGNERMPESHKFHQAEKISDRQKFNRESEQKNRPELQKRKEPSNHRSNQKAGHLKKGTREKQNKHCLRPECVGQGDATRRQHLNEIKKVVKTNRGIQKTQHFNQQYLGPEKFSQEVDYLRQRTQRYHQAFVNSDRFSQEVDYLSRRTQYFYQLFLNTQEKRPPTHGKQQQNKEDLSQQLSSERSHSTQAKQKKKKKYSGFEKLIPEKKSLKKKLDKFDLLV